MRFVTRERFRKGGIVTLVNLDSSLFPPADYISQFFADLVFSGVGGKVAVCAHRYSGEFGNLTSERALGECDGYHHKKILAILNRAL